MILPSGISLLDRIMNGGLNTGKFTHVYGEAAAGKTTFGLQFAVTMYRQDAGTIYINSEATSPVERLEQMTGRSFNDLDPLVKIFLPKGFNEQGALIEDLELYIRDNTRLVIIDTLTKHYRLALEDKKTNYVNHRELNRQAGVLKGLAKQRDIAVLVLNQVTSRMNGIDDFEPVAGNILDYWSDYVIKMNIGKSPGERLV
ncbi:MAG: hypothetical protein E4H14_19030, partial [Candidatus Thorarchaeota archaeon]